MKKKGKRETKLAIFDMDGTVFESRLDWQHIRSNLQIEPGHSILQTIYQGNQVDRQRLALLEEYEHKNTLQIEPIKGISDFIEYLKNNGLSVTLVTNNNKKNARYLLDKYQITFHQVITRESGLWKPEPHAFQKLMNEYSALPSQTLAIGDSLYDIKAARAAGISQIYVINGNSSLPLNDEEIIFFDDYHQLRKIIDL